MRFYVIVERDTKIDHLTWRREPRIRSLPGCFLFLIDPSGDHLLGTYVGGMVIRRKISENSFLLCPPNGSKWIGEGDAEAGLFLGPSTKSTVMKQVLGRRVN